MYTHRTPSLCWWYTPDGLIILCYIIFLMLAFLLDVGSTFFKGDLDVGSTVVKRNGRPAKPNVCILYGTSKTKK